MVGGSGPVWGDGCVVAWEQGSAQPIQALYTSMENKG